MSYIQMSTGKIADDETERKGKNNPSNFTLSILITVIILNYVCRDI